MSSDEFISISTSVPAENAATDSEANAGEPVAEISPEAAEKKATAKKIENEIDTTFDTELVTAPRDADLYQRSLQNAVIAAQCADEMRAKDVVVLDLTKIASIVDFFVIATGTSRRQMHAIADEINRKLKWERRQDRLGIEGYRTEANWVLMDFGDVVLHIFTEEGRTLYDLENLKADAQRIDWRSLLPEETAE